MNNYKSQDIAIIERYEMPYHCDFKTGDQIDAYQVEKKLGEGSFGIVFKVIHLKTKKCYALKLLKLWSMPHIEERKLMLKRFRREYECGRINSKHLVRSRNFGKISGNPYIVMDYCSNGNLHDLIGKHLTIEQITRFAYEILLGLKELHLDGKFHRDIKPENILLDENHIVKLTDFGIAGFKNERMTIKNVLGRTRDIFGTYAYIAPEQANNRTSFKAMNAVTDIFSFGVTMFELFTAHLPFGRIDNHGDLADYMMRAKTGDWDDIRTYRPNVPDDWVKIIKGCLNPEYKEKRFQNVDDIIVLLGYQPAKVKMLSYKASRDTIGLEVMHGEESGRRYQLSKMINGEEGILTLGWLDEGDKTKNHINIKENVTAYISNYHATIEKINFPERWFIRDGQWRKKDGQYAWYKSLNGVLVNSKSIDEVGQVIQPNDIITIGDTTLKVIILKFK